MVLSELKEAVDNAIETALEMGEDIGSIAVTLQIDGEHDESIWTDGEVTLTYDGNLQASGCVLHGLRICTDGCRRFNGVDEV